MFLNTKIFLVHLKIYIPALGLNIDPKLSQEWFVLGNLGLLDGQPGQLQVRRVDAYAESTVKREGETGYWLVGLLMAG